jgi:hypothetical protein
VSSFHTRWMLIALGIGVGSSSPVAAQPPALDYLQFCVGCHREDGSGSAQNGVPDMRGVIDRLVTAPTGRDFLIQVAGVAQTPLDDAALARLMNWLLPRMGALPADFMPYAADEITRLRASRPADLPAQRAQAVAELAARDTQAAAAP